MKTKTSKKMGRPPLPKSKRKIVIFARIPAAMELEVKRRARRMNLTPSEWIADVLYRELAWEEKR